MALDMFPQSLSVSNFHLLIMSDTSDPPKWRWHNHNMTRRGISFVPNLCCGHDTGEVYCLGT